ncbi:MAG: hypothetical protein IPM21_13360 [Acidobacteria bacterium]|nr:hypothetical protein [Acidobacteriota bacterium]
MSVVLELEPEVEEKLKKRASARGTGLNEYLVSVLKKHANISRTLDDVLAPARKNFADSGMTEDELAELVDREIKAVRAERKALK